MIPYLFFYLILAVCAAGELSHPRRVYFLVALVIATLFAGLRFETGYDWYAYELFFNAVDDLLSIYKNAYLLVGYSFEPGYSLVNSAVKTMGGGLALVFLIAACIHSVAFGVFACKYSKRPMLVMLGYVSVCYLVGQFIMIRFAVAAGLMLLTFSCIHQRKFFSAIILFFLALSFHISVLIFLILPLLSLPKLGKALVIFSLLVFVACISSGKGVQELLFTSMGAAINIFMGGDSQPLLAKFSSYSGFTSAVSSTSVMFAILNLIFYGCTFTQSLFSSQTDEEEWLLNMSRSLTVLLLLSLLLFPQLQTLWNRMMLVAMPFQLVVLSNTVRSVSPLKLSNIYLSAYVASFLFFGYALFKPDPNLFLPYESSVQSYFFGSQGYKRSKMLDFF